MKRDQIIIFTLVGVMVFSAIATGLLFLSQPEASEPTDQTDRQADTSEERACQPSADVAAQPGRPEGEWPAEVEGTVDNLRIIDLRQGSGPEAGIGNCISVHYRLSLADGTPIDGNDTFAEGAGPIAFELNSGSLIEGWVQGIPGMMEGGLRRLIVPAGLAYGDTQRPGIAAGSDLVFDVELVKIEY